MVAAREEIRRQAVENAAPVVADERCFAMHELTCLTDLPAEHLHDRLVPQANAQSWDPDGQTPHQFGCSPCLLRSPGSR